MTSYWKLDAVTIIIISVKTLLIVVTELFFKVSSRFCCMTSCAAGIGGDHFPFLYLLHVK